MRVHTGTSGFSYDEWRGGFYPKELTGPGMLGYYSTRLASVEVNNTFYQMPKAALLERWRDMVPSTFRFALKSPRRITHVLRLKDAREALGFFFGAAAVLGERLGPVLFQLPPFARKDATLLRDFLALLPADCRPAFEFRHPSWFDDEIYGVLRERQAALCGGDSDEADRSPPLVPTADWGYLRLRAPSYDAASLKSWEERILAQPWTLAYVYFKHEVHGPAYALYLDALAAGNPPPALPDPVPAAAPSAGKSARPKRAPQKKKA